MIELLLIFGVAALASAFGFGDDDDVILARDGDDTVQGGDGDDYMVGGNDDDDLRGGAGDDSINGGDGDDTIDGGTGIDLMVGGVGDDLILGQEDNDFISGQAGADTLGGGDGNDLITGYYDGSDETGYELRDELDPDQINGGAGMDVFAPGIWIDPETPAVIEDYSQDEDQIVMAYPTDYAGDLSIEIGQSSDDPDDATVLVGGQVALLVTGGYGTLSASDVSLVAVDEFA